MKIEIRKIPLEGFKVVESIEPKALDLETELVKFDGQIKLEAQISMITNTVTAEIELSADVMVSCSRCLGDIKQNINKSLRLSYSVEPGQLILDLSQDIREEIMLDYSLQPLCKPACKGLCPKCGGNLNESQCGC